MCNISTLRNPNQPIQLPKSSLYLPNGSSSSESSKVISSLTTAVTDAMKTVHQAKQQRQPVRKSAHNGHHHPPVIVQHNYHDHAMEAPVPGAEDIVRRPARGGVTTPFPDRLHELLDQFEADGRAHIISWQPHGRCFIIRKADEFKELLPEYFKLSKMSSFQRQLNLYGFQRLTRGRDRGAYYHEYFLRNMLHLSTKIERTKVKGTGVRARSNPAAEPNLWDLPWVGPHAKDSSNTPSVSSTASVASTTRSDRASVSSVEDSAPSSPKQAILITPPMVLSTLPVDPPTRSWTPLPALSSLAAPPKLPTAMMEEAPMEAVRVVAAKRMEEAPMEAVSVVAPQSPLVPVSILALATPLEVRNDDDLVVSFGGKSFHYLDPFQLMESSKKPVDPPAAHNEDFVADMQLDELAEKLDEDEDDLENDDVFMNMLEHVISE